jgi:hypothetical protein
MNLNAYGQPIFRARYIGHEERDGVVVFKFTKPASNISGLKNFRGKGYSVGFISWFKNLYVDYIAIDKNVHGDPREKIKQRLNEIMITARENGWTKRLTAEAEALTILLNTV